MQKQHSLESSTTVFRRTCTILAAAALAISLLGSVSLAQAATDVPAGPTAAADMPPGPGIIAVL